MPDNPILHYFSVQMCIHTLMVRLLAISQLYTKVASYLRVNMVCSHKVMVKLNCTGMRANFSINVVKAEDMHKLTH